jgi:drug/metabolite transporter (DMT)-like permease
VASAFILREKVTLGRWLAVFAGFAGVLFVTNAGNVQFSWVMLLPLIAACFVVARDLITRRLDAGIHSVYVVLATLGLVAVAGAVTSVFDWRPVTLSNVAWLFVSGVLLSLGFYGNIRAIRIGELSYIAPFLFTGILVAVFWGYTIWGDTPTVGSGLYILTRAGKPAENPVALEPH